jgi:predicted ABC-type ATPase
MTQPRMFIIAGPPGAGKSSIFSLSDFAENIFNADDRAAELNGGSYQSLPLSVRKIANRDFEAFVQANISAGTSFALETHCAARLLSNRQGLPNRKASA